MHIKRITVKRSALPDIDQYPFNCSLFSETFDLTLKSPVSVFIGSNGCGKSTVLEALARRCDYYIWEEPGSVKTERNVHQKDLYKFLKAEWSNSSVPGAFFSSEIFKNFTFLLDEWMASDPGIIDYYGGRSLLTQSHGQGHMAYFENRFNRKGLYLLDEPENALSPQWQIKLMNLIGEISKRGDVQFVMATHSPILMAIQGAEIYNFDSIPVEKIDYDDTENVRVYREFLLK